MTDEVNRILEAALELSERERAEIAAILESSLGDGSSPEEIQASWIAEAKRRLAAYQRGETTAVDFDDVMERLRAKVRRVPRKPEDESDEVGRLLDAAMQLPEVDRARLATMIADNIGDGTTREAIDAAVLAEAKRRLEDLDSGRTQPIPYDVVKQKLRATVARARRQASTG